MCKSMKIVKTSGYINMKKNLITLLLLPFLLVSCKSAGDGFDAVKNRINDIDSTPKFPYYKVNGSLDFNNEILPVNATFDKTPSTETFVPYARFNNGFYNDAADNDAGEENVVIYGLASHSYWLRAPMRLHKDNFYVLNDKGKENDSCGHYILSHIITSFMSQPGSTNPSSSVIYYELLSDGGFAIGGKAVHTEFTLDNYPYYPDFDSHPELGVWDDTNPLPCYKSIINAKVNVRFEYNSDGWLVKESLSSLDYNYSKASADQIALVAEYTYKFA